MNRKLARELPITQKYLKQYIGWRQQVGIQVRAPSRVQLYYIDLRLFNLQTDKKIQETESSLGNKYKIQHTKSCKASVIIKRISLKPQVVCSNPASSISFVYFSLLEFPLNHFRIRLLQDTVNQKVNFKIATANHLDSSKRGLQSSPQVSTCADCLPFFFVEGFVLTASDKC